MYVWPRRYNVMTVAVRTARPINMSQHNAHVLRVSVTAESFIIQVNKLLPAQAATHAQQQPVLLSQRKSLEIRTLFHYAKLHLSIFS